MVKKDTRLKDICDLNNHREILNVIFDLYKKLILDNATILKMHKMLMKNRAQWVQYDPILGGAGEFKLENNYGYRGSSGYKKYLPFYQVASEMEKLCEITNGLPGSDNHEVEAMNQFHYRFANEIHPFTDGNGRMARLLHNMLLLKQGYPVLMVKENQKRQYLDSIIEQEKNPKGRAFDKFMNGILEKTLVSHIDKAIDNDMQGGMSL